MRLILVRHGDAHAGFHGPIAGPTGCAGLTDLGRQQAEALRDHLAATGRIRADVLISSVLPRAVETATIIAPGLGLELSAQDCDLCEVHTGEADGVDWADYNDRFGSFDMEAEPDRVFAPGGDSWNSFHGRVEGVLERLARDHARQTVVVACHAGVIMASLRILLGVADPRTSAHIRPSNTGLTEWEHDPISERWILRSYNEAGHILPLQHTIEGARAAAARDELAAWVGRFLGSEGSDNAALGQALVDRECCWIGPVQVPIDRLHRLAGAPGQPVLEEVEEHEWRDDVHDLALRVAAGLEPAPIVATRDEHGQLKVEDGNHRLEALRRAGLTEAWTVVGFDDPADRDAFLRSGADGP